MSAIIKDFMGEPHDITKYYSTFPEGGYRDKRYLKGTFVKFGWLFIGDWKVDDERLEQIGVKAEQNKGEASDEMAYEYEINGWDMGSFPPTQGTDGQMRDGRTRIIGAIKKGQQWIPVAIYHFEESDTPTKDKVTEGVRGNAHHPVTRSTSEDFVVAGIASIDAGELKRDPSAIMEWLIHDAQIDKRFSNTNGQYTRIVTWIMERTANKNNLTVVMDRDGWLDWCDKIPLNTDRITLYKANPTNAVRLWCDDILPNAGKGTPVILYADYFTPEKCCSAVEMFISSLDKMYKETYSLVNNDLSESPLSLSPPKTKPYKIYGVCPNLKRGDQPMLYKNHELISVEDYIRDGSPITKALGIAA